MSSEKNKFVFFLSKIIILFHSLRKLNPWRKKIILIDKTDGMGDIIMWLPYAKVMREHFPRDKYKLNILIYHFNKGLISNFDFFDNIIEIPPYKGKLQWLCFRIGFWLNSIDILISFHYVPSDLLIPYIPEEIISFHHSKIQKFEIGKKKTTFLADDLSIHDRFLVFLKHIGCPASPATFDYKTLILPPPEGFSGQDAIVICPGASRSDRCWEIEKFIQLIDKLQKRFDNPIVLVGTRKEKDICKKIYEGCLKKNSIIDLSGKTSIRQLFGVISQAKFLISNETGTAHIGGVLGTKTFIISGGGDYGDFVPYPKEKEGKTVFSIFRKDHHCFRCMWSNADCYKDGKAAPCISEITVDMVLRKIMTNSNITTEKRI